MFRCLVLAKILKILKVSKHTLAAAFTKYSILHFANCQTSLTRLLQERTASLMQIFLTNTSRFTTGSVADLDLDFLAQRLKTDGALENMTGWRPFPG